MSSESTAPSPTIRVPHVRANDFRELYADGIMQRYDGVSMFLTFYINDQVVTHEDMVLASADASGLAVYKPGTIGEQTQRTDLVAVRLPIQAFMDAYNLFMSKMKEASEKGQVA